MRNLLTEQRTLSGHTAPSRVLFGPHETNLGDDRALSARHVAYYERRARGGAGVIVTETASVHPGDWPYERAPLAADCGPGWRAVVEACRPHGTLVLASLGHTGLQGSSAWSQSALWAPSRFPDPVSRELPMEMERAEIDALVTGFASAARLAVGSGTAGVELDAGPRSLLRQFLSGLTNHRTDGYGTDRTRLLREVIAAVRGELGDRILALRLSCDEEALWAGITPEQAADHVCELSDSLDLLVVVRGGPFSVDSYRPDGHTEPGFNRELCRSVRRVTRERVPVVLQGSMVDAALAQRALDDGVADLVEMTRAQIADPDLVDRIRNGRRPRPCVLCNQACLVRDPRNPVVTCIGNPTAGFETVDPAPSAPPGSGADTALVVGGGPAGLEAARVLAERGVRVTLAERTSRIGGAVSIAAAGAGRARLAGLVDWLEAECRRLGVDIRAGTEIDAADIERAQRSGTTVVVAVGSVPRPPSWRVADGVQVVPATGLLEGVPLRSGPVLVFDPVGGPVAVSVALTLIEQGRAVAIVTPDQILGSRLGPTGDLVAANRRLRQAGVTAHPGAVPVAAGGGEVLLQNRFTGEHVGVACSVLVDCSHPLPNEQLTEADAVRVGDCVAPRTVLEAVREGRFAAAAGGSASSRLPKNVVTSW